MTRILLPMFFLATLPTLVAQNLPSWAEPYEPPPPEQRGGGPDNSYLRDCGPFPCPPPDPAPVPIDGGLGLLALAGGAYAVRRLRGRNDP